VVDGYIAQFGIAGDPTIAPLWNRQTLRPDARRTENVRGTLTYAQFTRTDRMTNLFINLRDNPTLDSLGVTPIGRVVPGLTSPAASTLATARRPRRSRRAARGGGCTASPIGTWTFGIRSSITW
jgi:hypothetical protein